MRRTRFPRLWIALVGAWFALVFAPPAARAPLNQIDNGEFDMDVSGWNNQFHTGDFQFSWDSTDLNGSPDSGSLRNTTTITNSLLDGPLYCVALGPASYQATGWILIPSQIPSPSGALMLTFWDHANCTNDALGNSTSETVGDDGAWHQLTVEGVAPGGTQGVSVELASGGTTDPTPVHAYFDHVSLIVPEPQAGDGVTAVLTALALHRRLRRASSSMAARPA